MLRSGGAGFGERPEALSRLEEKKSDVAQVGEDEVVGLVRHAAGKVPPHDAVPRGVVPPVKLLRERPLRTQHRRPSAASARRIRRDPKERSGAEPRGAVRVQSSAPRSARLGYVYPLYMSCNAALRAVLLQRPHGALHGLLLHLLRHVRVLYHRLLFAHGPPHQQRTAGSRAAPRADAHRRRNALTGPRALHPPLGATSPAPLLYPLASASAIPRAHWPRGGERKILASALVTIATGKSGPRADPRAQRPLPARPEWLRVRRRPGPSALWAGIHFRK